MKKSQPWHHTRAGEVVLWLGSVELAVPVLALTSAALAVGTYLDSTRGAQVAKSVVYASWWFVALMALVCVSLVFAVVSRYPWKRRHVGFMTVHASLVALIAGGFWSYFGRVEGNLALQEGTTGNSIETMDERIEAVEHQAGSFVTVDAAVAPRSSGALTLAGQRVQVVERWENSRDEEQVTDDSPGPFRAVRVSVRQGTEAIWVGEEERGGGAAVIGGLRIRVLPDGAAWEPPPPGEPVADYEFTAGEHRHRLGGVGEEAVPGWTIVSVRRFARAMVGAEGLTDLSSGPENPAVEVVITDGQGSTERHTAFLHFPDMVMARPLEGSASSGARLSPSAAAGAETLVVYGPNDAPEFAYVAPTGEARTFEPGGPFPRVLEAGARRITIEQQFGRARGGWRTLRAPRGSENRPALVLRIGDATELTVVSWKSMAPLGVEGRNVMLRYGPRVVPLPFTVRLEDFRKTDYPGTQMAMAYESDVAVTLAGKEGSPPTPYRIFMNNPYTHGPWKVYQSGFVGDNVSIFSVMRDPGLPLTYTATAFLCVGILITFYSRSMSWGHPGIPIASPEKEPSHASSVRPAADPRPAAVGEPAGACIV